MLFNLVSISFKCVYTQGHRVQQLHLIIIDNNVMASIAFVFVTGVLVQHGIKVTCEKTGNFKSTLQKSYRSVAFLLNNCKLPNDEV